MPTKTGGEATVDRLIAHVMHASARRLRFIDSKSY